MAEAKIKYSSSSGITITTANLADGIWRTSAVVSNVTNLYMDALVTGSIQAGTLSVQGSFGIYAYASIDGGTVYSGGVGGSDETITWGTTGSTSIFGYLQLALLGLAQTDQGDDNEDIEFGPFSIASAFGGTLPQRWGVVFHNDSGATTHSTGTNNTMDYIGVTYTVA